MGSPSRRLRHAGPALIAVLLLAGVLPSTVAAAPARAYALDLGRRADFVPQATFVQCVGASMQMMINMAEPGRDRSATTQRRLQAIARGLSGPSPDGFIRQGANVMGWAAGLNQVGAGPYQVVGKKTLQAALKAAARAIRLTGRPVGLLVWRGRHAWVMSGFRATADPLTTRDFKVTHAIVEDPLYPHGSKTWGPSPAPGAALTPTVLGRQFVRRQSSSRWAQVSTWSLSFADRYVMVVPYPMAIPGPARLI